MRFRASMVLFTDTAIRPLRIIRRCCCCGLISEPVLPELPPPMSASGARGASCGNAISASAISSTAAISSRLRDGLAPTAGSAAGHAPSFAVSPIPALRDIGTNSRVIAATQTRIDTSDIPPTSSPVFNLGDISPSKLVISAVRLSWPLHEYDAPHPGFVPWHTIELIPAQQRYLQAVSHVRASHSTITTKTPLNATSKGDNIMETVNVLVARPFPAPLMHKLENITPRLNITQRVPADAEELADLVGSVEILYAPALLREPEDAPRLRWVQIHSAGADQVLQHRLFTETDVTITTTSGIHAVNIAEYVLAQMLAFAHHLPTMFEDKRAKNWPEDRWERYLPHELRGATVGIVGYGSIGR